MATIVVQSQLVTPATDMAIALGPCRNSSGAIIHGMGPATERCHWL